MSLIVAKFGGTSVASPERIQMVAKKVIAKKQAGHDVVAVVSAMGKTTDELVGLARALNQDPPAREMDRLLSTGEQVSMTLLAMAIEARGYKSMSFTGRQAGIETDGMHAKAKIVKVHNERIMEAIAAGAIPVVAGFQGIDANGDITTLGRGGSDTTAVAVAWGIGADVCEIYSDVDGVYTADPRLVPNARKLPQISFDEMLELASLGAQVLNNRSVELAKKYSVELEVRSSLTDVPGTIVKEVAPVEGMLIKGVTKNENVAVISLLEVPDVPGMSFNVFSLMAQKKINVGIILQASGRGNNKDLIFTVPLEDVHTAVAILEENLQRFGATKVLVDTDVAKVSIVGAGVQSHPGVAAKMFERLYECNINIRMIATSEIKISVIIAKQDADRAVAAVHEAFFQ